MIGILSRVIESGERVQIIYMSNKGEVSQRFITPLNINESHVICYCHYRKQRRMLKLDNILSAMPMKNRAN